MNVLISGASGFVGLNLLEFLEKETIIEKKLKLFYLTSKVNPPLGINVNSEWVTISNNGNNIQEIMNAIKPNVFVNLAWQGIPDYSLNNSVSNIQLNTSMIEAAFKAGAKRVITTGSCWEYYKPYGIVSENNTLDESNYFKVAKNTVRKYGDLISKRYEAEFVWLRLFYVYGKFQNKHSLLPSLISQALKGLCPKANNTESKLDFVSAKFVSEVISKIINLNRLDFTIFNVGSGKTTSIVEIINEVRKYFGITTLEKEALSYKQDFAADISRIENFGLQNNTSILNDIPTLIENMKLCQ